MNKPARKAIRDSEMFWQLEGESNLDAITIPDPPTPGVANIVRLTHSNSLGPFDEVDLFVRVGDPDKPTDQDDLDSVMDWVQTRLVEELVTVGDEEMLRSEVRAPIGDWTLWEGTYETQLVVPSGMHSIEIKLISHHPKVLRSMVLGGWEVSAR